MCGGSWRPFSEVWVLLPWDKFREKTKEALLELKAVLETHPKMVAHFPVEVRFTRGDDILLSPCFQRDSCYMNIIMYRCPAGWEGRGCGRAGGGALQL